MLRLFNNFFFFLNFIYIGKTPIRYHTLSNYIHIFIIGVHRTVDIIDRLVLCYYNTFKNVLSIFSGVLEGIQRLPGTLF